MQKLLYVLTLTLLSCLALHAQPNLNMTLLASWDEPGLPVASPGNLNLKYSGCWGLVANGREIAVLGGAAEVFFFDVTVPTAPQLLGRFPGGDTTVWREFKSFKNRVYAVSDGANEGMMIFDLSDPNNIKKTYQSSEFLVRGHTITLDTTSGRAYINGGSAGNGIIVLDLNSDPDQPQFLGHPNLDVGDMGGYVHDSYVRHDTLYCSSGWEGYYVIDFKDPVNPTLVASCTTSGYNHNSWVTSDGKYAYYTEEVPKGRPIRIVDLQNMNTQGEIEPVDKFLDNLLFPGLPDSAKLAISHNVYIRGNLLFNSQYEDGLLVYNISDPLNPILIAHYDTHPQNSSYTGYYGNWGNYPWLPSGTIVAGDMQNGLYLLQLAALGTNAPGTLQATVSPNPASESFNVLLDEGVTEDWTYALQDAQGRVLRQATVQQTNKAAVDVRSLPVGLYFVTIRTDSGRTRVVKVVRG